MNANSSPQKIGFRIPASTTNLGPGFDVLGLAVSLHSTIEIELIDGRTEIVINGVDREKISSDISNPAFRAAEMIFRKVDQIPNGMRLTINNGIPAIRGLGGSGTAILGGLLCANAICGDPFSRSEILDFAIEFEGHPDNVSASLLGGLTISVMSENGGSETLRIKPPKNLRVIVAIPNFTLATKTARDVLPKTIDLKSAIYNVSRSTLLATSIAMGQLHHLKIAMSDRFHEPYRSKLIPGFNDVVKSAIDAGAIGVALSGAGSTIAAFANVREIGEDQLKVIASKMIEAFRKNDLSATAEILTVDNDGAVEIKSEK